MYRTPSDRSKLALALLLAPAAILAPALRAEAPDEDSYLGESPERYAQVKVVEGDVMIHKGDGEEAMTRGVPLAEGDVVESRGRGVLQLGDGTRLAFGSGTRFQIAALFTDRKGDRQVLLRLDYGRIRVTVGPQSEARIRVDTPSGTATLANRASATCEVEQDHTVRIRVHSGRAGFANDADRASLTAGERITIYDRQDRLDRVRSFNTYDADAFDGWCEAHLAIRRGASWDRVPPEIRYYADDLDGHGEWIYVDETSSWCWRPTGLSVEWRPYWNGHWGAFAGGMTWISDEPWGYVTHHHGRWGWGASLGWYWIPGVYYSPAWVAWNTCDTYFGWAPLGYWNAPCHWGYGAWGGGYCWNVVSVGYIGHRDLHRRIYSDVHIIRDFNRGTGASNWSGAPSGRSLTPPWQRGPLMVSRSEFANPGQFQRVVSQRPLLRDRMQAYDRQAQTATGRTILRRDPGTAPRGAQGPAQRELRPTPFEDRNRPVPGRPVIRDNRPSPRDAGQAPRQVQPEQPRSTAPGRTIAPRDTPDVRPRDERPRATERPANPRDVSRERVQEPRSREMERPTVRETPRERPEPSRQEAPRERTAPVQRETPRSEPTREVRQERPSAPSQSSAPRQSAPERPSSDRPRGR